MRKGFIDVTVLAVLGLISVIALGYSSAAVMDFGSGGVVVLPASGGAGTPGGLNTQIQFNNSGAFGGSADLTWDNANGWLALSTSTPESSVTMFTEPGGILQFIDTPNDYFTNPALSSKVAIQTDSLNRIASISGTAATTTPSASAAYFDVYADENSSYLDLYNAFTGNELYLSTNQDSYVVNNGYNFGIGTGTPTSKLQVSGDIHTEGALKLSTTTTTIAPMYISPYGDNEISISDNPMNDTLGQGSYVFINTNSDQTNQFTNLTGVVSSTTGPNAQWNIGSFISGVNATDSLSLSGTVGTIYLNDGGTSYMDVPGFNFGIGTAAPTSKLQVVGDVAFGANSDFLWNDSQGMLSVSSSSPGTIPVNIFNSNGYGLVVSPYTASEFDINNGTDISGMVFSIDKDAGGSVSLTGFATSTTLNDFNQFSLTASANNTALTMNTHNSLLDIELNTDADSFIANNDNFGIGTSSPSAKLHITSNGNSTTTIAVGSFSDATSHACFNTKNTAGDDISFYFVGTTLTVEANLCN